MSTIRPSIVPVALATALLVSLTFMRVDPGDPVMVLLAMALAGFAGSIVTRLRGDGPEKQIALPVEMGYFGIVIGLALYVIWNLAEVWV